MPVFHIFNDFSRHWRFLCKGTEKIDTAYKYTEKYELMDRIISENEHLQSN
jgi:hypothetical protein